MNTDYQMWMTHNGRSSKLRIPVLPEIFRVTIGSKNKSIDISGLGEITIMQDRPAIGLEFESFFPAGYFPGMRADQLTSPGEIVDKIMSWKHSTKPVQFVVTGSSIDTNMYCTIEDFPHEERGGDVGTVYYSLRLKEYREVAARQIQIQNETATVSNTETRTDNRVTPQTYTVKAGDCLWKIALALLGSGNRYKEIYELNRDKIANPDLIYPGQVFVLPAA